MKWFKKIVLSVSIVFLLAAAGFYIYVSDYYRADDTAKAALEEGLKTGEAIAYDRFIVIPAKKQTDSALIFYPGGKVEAASYYPLLSDLSKRGITCILVKMPFHLAVLNPQAADQIYGILPEIKNWYIGGHSLGGAMASSYMAKNPARLKGVILLGAYRYGDVTPSKAITIYGTLDGVLNREKINYKEQVFPIEGGNHGNFGNYGRQKGDLDAAISTEDQQEQTAGLVQEFIRQSNLTPGSPLSDGCLPAHSWWEVSGWSPYNNL